MTRLAALFLAPVLACSATTGADSTPVQGGDTCTVLTDGTWTLGGAAWGMGDQTMTGTVTMDTASCTFTLDGYDMQMDDLPTGGGVDGDQVQLDGLTSYWRSCVGTATDGNDVAGTCSDDGSAFAMVVGG